MINAFGICHTRLIGATQHVHRVQNSREIGPKNILRNILLKIKENNSMQAKISDVGLSRIINKDYYNSLTPMLGSFSYMSPEIRTGRCYDYKTDIWYLLLQYVLK
jgi:serine/threonine protein kinase